MKVNSNNNRDITFNGFLNNKTFKKGLKFAADNGTHFAAATTLVLSLTARPAAIMLTPKTDKENRKLAFAKSLASTFSTYLLMLVLSQPLAGSVKRINKQPQKYLNKETIQNFKDTKAYDFATQMFKLGAGLLAAIPKAILTAATVPAVMNQIYPKKNDSNGLTFKGLPKGIGKALNNKKYQNFSKKYQDTNFPMHIIALTDTLSTGAFIYQTKKSKSIKEERKNPLCYNAAISTALSIICGYTADKMTQKPTEKFIRRFSEVNKNDPELKKCIEGIRIAKPILLVAGIYYMLIPFISTFLAERIHSKDYSEKANPSFSAATSIKR